MIEKPQVTIYTDGSCWGNPGPGGWAAIINENGRERSLSGVSDNTTNNRMELTAALQALKSLKHSSNIHLYTDSEYLKRGYHRMDGRLESTFMETQGRSARQPGSMAGA